MVRRKFHLLEAYEQTTIEYKPVLGTLKIRQLFNMGEGIIGSREEACACTHCFNFEFKKCANLAYKTTIMKKADKDTPTTNDQTEDEPESTIPAISVGTFYAIVFDNEWYPGQNFDIINSCQKLNSSNWWITYFTVVTSRLGRTCKIPMLRRYGQ
jgi:hypothetical protein